MATKKISELPLITRVSGSQMGGTVLPVVVGGTTDQISVENFSKFITAYSAHTGSAGNTFTGPQIINNNVTITGKLTVNELVATYETASVIYSEGGNIFGNELTDKQQFTGSSNFTGSVFINGQNYTTYSSSNSTVFTNFSSSNSTYNTTFSSSNATYVTALSSSNSSYNTTFSSSNSSYNTTFSSSNSSYNTTFSSSNETYVTALSSSNSSYNTIFSSSNSTTITTLIAGNNSQLARLYQTTESIQFQTASLLQFTASQDSRNFTLSQVTGSFRGELGGLEAYSASLKGAAIVSSSTQVQNYDLFALNSNLYISTGSIKGEIAGLEALTASMKAQTIVSNSAQLPEIAGLETYTASLKTAAIVSSSTQVQNYDIFGLNSNLYRATGSLIGITNGLMAFTASLDNTYATDAQLYQLYQATASIQFQTASLLQFTASQDSRNFTLSQITGSFRGEIAGLEAYTASLKAAAIVSSSTQIQNYDVFALNSNLYNGTGSLIAITNGLMALTASMKNSTIVSSSNQLGEIAGLQALTASFKAASIVSSSTQIQNYNLFAQTASANTFYGNQTISGSLIITGSNTLIGTKTISGSVLITGSKIIVGSNTVVGTSTFSGSLFMSGSVYGNVTAQPVASNTSSIDISTANFFTITLGSGTGTSGVTTHISASNMRAGQSVNILITTGTNSSASFSTNIKQPSGSFYQPTSGSGNKDILSLVSFDTTSLYLVAVNQMI